MKTLILTLLALLSFETSAQVSYKKITQSNLESFAQSATPITCTGKYDVTATGSIDLKLKDGTTVVLVMTYIDRETSTEHNNYPGSCSDATAGLVGSINATLLGLFAIVSGDVQMSVENKVQVCYKNEINVMLNGTVATKYNEVRAPVKCP